MQISSNNKLQLFRHLTSRNTRTWPCGVSYWPLPVFYCPKRASPQAEMSLDRESVSTGAPPNFAAIP